MEDNKKTLVITYPPTFDGELHINAAQQSHMYSFDFKYTTTGSNDAWEALVKAARDIIEQDTHQHGPSSVLTE